MQGVLSRVPGSTIVPSAQYPSRVSSRSCSTLALTILLLQLEARHPMIARYQSELELEPRRPSLYVLYD